MSSSRENVIKGISVRENIARIKSKSFALRIISTFKKLHNEKKEFVLSKQLLRSGTSIGANIAEAECAISKKDFQSKIYIALKESAETKYWLELLCESQYISKQDFEKLYADCEEIRRILSSTTKTMIEKYKK